MPATELHEHILMSKSVYTYYIIIFFITKLKKKNEINKRLSNVNQCFKIKHLYIFYSDFVKLSELLYKSLDLHKSGKADKVLCDTVLEQLRTALASNRTDARR